MGVAALISMLGPVVLPSLIQLAEHLIPSKTPADPNAPKQGVDRLAMVGQMARAAIDKLIATGQKAPDGSVITQQPSDDSLLSVIETIFQQMKGAGTVNNVPTPTVTATQPTKLLPSGTQLFLLTGTVQPINIP